MDTATYPTAHVFDYTYNAAGRPLSLTDTTLSINYVSACSTAPCYAPNGALLQARYGVTGSFAGITVQNSYNNRLQPIFISAAAASPIISLCYDFHSATAINSAPCSFAANTTGDNGNVFQIVNNRDGNRTQNFLYDSLNRIQQAYTNGTNWGETMSPTATAPGTAPTTPGIDAWGNLTNRSGVTGKTNTELFGGAATIQNRLTGFGYDAAGNMTSNGNASYTYDAENHIISAGGYTYSYDGDGNRVKKANGSAGTIYWRDASSEVINESNLAGTMQNEYIFFSGERMARFDVPTGHKHYYFSNHLGSASVITSDLGVIQEELDYYPYGGEIAITNGDPNNYKFTGKERDSESGLDNFGARYHASTMGRWMVPDAINLTDERLLNPTNTLNKYAYGGNNPLKYIDPDGRDITVFYTDTGRGGHFWMVAYDPSTRQSAVADFGPQNGDSRVVQAEEGAGMDVPGDVNYQSHMSADEMRQDYTSLTIQTNPGDAQKAIQAINEFNGKAEQYNLYSRHGNENCTTICRDILKKILKLDSTSIRPKSLWSDIFKKWSNQALTQPSGSKPPTVQSNHGIDYGQPRYPINTFDFVWRLLHPERACVTVTVTTYGPNGTGTTGTETKCED